MKIQKGTLVACDAYGDDKTRTKEKRALGIVLESEFDRGEEQFKVQVFYPSMTVTLVGVTAKELLPLAQNCNPVIRLKNVTDHLPEIILALARENDNLKRQLQSLADANRKLL